MNKLVSIVIPMFNAKQNLKECIDSVLLQDYEPLEVIFINDGSTDSTVEICEEYCLDYSYMSLYSQDNQGPGAARNKGIDLAKGEYICFLDADDYFDGEDVISKLVICAETNQADIVCGSFRKLTEEGISDVNYHHLDEVEVQDSVEFRFRGFFLYGHLGFNWGKLYRKQFINNNQLFIPTYPYIEDKAFNMRCCICRPKYAFIQESIYVYRLSNQVVDFQDKEDFASVWSKVAIDLDDYNIKLGHQKDCLDMQAFHVFLGLYSLGKQRMNLPNIKLRDVKNALSEYGNIQCVKKYLKHLAKGMYVSQIEFFCWKILIRIIAIICSWNGYYVLALGMYLMKCFKIDQKVISQKYK